MSRRAPILNLYKAEKNFDLLPNFWYIKDSNITLGAQRKIFEKGTIFFGHPVQLLLKQFNTDRFNKKISSPSFRDKMLMTSHLNFHKVPQPKMELCLHLFIYGGYVVFNYTKLPRLLPIIRK